MGKSKTKAVAALFLLATTTPAWAESNSAGPLPEKFSPREHAWSIGTTLRRLDISATNDYKVHALAPYLDIGRGWVHPKWWSLFELNLILGPNSQRLPESPPLDFIGTGVRVRAGTAPLGRPLRDPSGDWGVEIGLEYSEWIARSYRDETLADGTISNSWVVRSRWILLQPAVFYSLWQPARPQGNRPEWITTRIEGVVFSLGFSIPLQSQMQANFNKAGEQQQISDRWQGTLLSLSLTTWLGI